MFEFSQYWQNPIICLIVLLAVFSYQLLLELFVHTNKDQNWLERARQWLPGLQVLLNCLPLLGLLGTVIGLLDTFRQMSYGSIDQQTMLSSGIADALLTTEVGLLMVIPGWLLLAQLQRRINRYQVALCVQD